MLQLKKEERILLQRKANFRFLGSKKAVGTLFITNLRLLFFPLLHKRMVEIYLDCIKTVELLEGWTKKIKIITEKKECVIFVRGAESIINLINAIMQ